MVPNGWLFTQIEHICSFKSGGTPSKQKLEYWGSDEPWISGKDLKSHYLYTSIDKLSHLGFSVAKKAPEGSSLILVRGMTLLKDFPVGYATKELAFNQDIKALIPNKGIDGLYLSFLLFGNKHKIKDLVTTAGHGTGRLDTETLKEFHVTVPPLPEQQKIAKILSTWDKAITTTEKLIATSQQQKKALMQQLLTGKKRLVNPETGKVFEGDWEEVQQGNVATFYNGRAYKQSEWEESGTPVIRLQNLTGRGSEFYYSNLELPERQYCEFGDLLYMWSATFGPAIWHGDKAIYHYHIWKVECNESWLNKLFMYFLLDFETQKWMSQSNGMGLLHITKTTMEKQVISLPYVVEQQKIASVLTAADKEIELLQARLTHLKDEKKALMQQLLTGKRRVKVEAPEAA